MQEVKAIAGNPWVWVQSKIAKPLKKGRVKAKAVNLTKKYKNK